mgnify:CR=1 FL=1
MANYNVYFSPTGTTERVVKHMGESFGSMENIDLSRRDMKNHEMKQGDFCIVGVPSFGGRVPGIATERLRKIRCPAFFSVARSILMESLYFYNFLYGSFIYSMLIFMHTDR